MCFRVLSFLVVCLGLSCGQDRTLWVSIQYRFGILYDGCVEGADPNLYENGVTKTAHGVWHESREEAAQDIQIYLFRFFDFFRHNVVDTWIEQRTIEHIDPGKKPVS